MMKLVFVVILSMVALTALDCGTPPSLSLSNPHNFTIVTSFYPLYIMAKNVTANMSGVSVVNLTPSTTGCLHDYSPTTDDFIKLATANIFVTQGAGMEGFMDRVVAGYPKLTVASLTEGIPLINTGGAPNPHTWLNVDYAIQEVQNLAQALATSDPNHAQQYRNNAEKYITRLVSLRDEMKSALAFVVGREIITFHEAFPYFAQEFGLVVATVVEREPGTAPSARELADVIDLIKEKGIKAVFVEPQYPSETARTIADQTGVKILTLDPAVTGPDDPDAYLRIMRNNLVTLREGLQ